ncbi:MAG: TIGR04283 family arsenosugar biosynthesis glycosyltransferase [Gammaproteobacteria bacterium]
MILEGPELTIIVPMLNEAARIEHALQRLQSLRKRGVEIIVVDGGSVDESVAIAEPYVDLLIESGEGIQHNRAKQMNAGAFHATGRILLFLHADTQLPDQAYKLILQAMELPHVWGRFDVKLSGENFMFRIIETMMNLRSGLTGVATGDQGIFVMRHIFEEIKGFRDYPIMEDIDISKRLRKKAYPVCLKQKAITSSRRWEKNGIFKTIGLMWWLRFLYFIGAHPRVLVQQYYKKEPI